MLSGYNDVRQERPPYGPPQVRQHPPERLHGYRAADCDEHERHTHQRTQEDVVDNLADRVVLLRFVVEHPHGHNTWKAHTTP
jgi:hypothetical protein